jgi:flotillin
MSTILLIVGLVAIVVVTMIVYTLKNLIFVASPNQVLVLAGRSRKLRDGSVVGFRAVRGGRATRVPLLETVHWMDLSNVPVEIEVRHAFSKGGIPLNVQGVAHVKLPGEEPRLHSAVERFLGRSLAEIAEVARETLEGNVRGVLAQLTPEQVNEDKIAFANQLLGEAEHDFVRMGLVLDTLKIQNVTDDANYLNSIGRIRGAGVRRDARVAEVQATSQAAIQKAGNWCQSELADIKANLSIACKETEKRIMNAETGREKQIAEARGEVLAMLAKIDEDVIRQGERVVQVERQLDADVVQPWEAERKKLEQEAQADAAMIVERGRAEAEALGMLVEEYKSAGARARELMVLQQLMPMLESIAGAKSPVQIKEWTVLDSQGSSGDFAERAIAASEKLRAATGVDIAAVAKRFGSSE